MINFVIFKIKIQQKYAAIPYINVMVSNLIDVQEITMHYILIPTGHSLFGIQIEMEIYMYPRKYCIS